LNKSQKRKKLHSAIVQLKKQNKLLFRGTKIINEALVMRVQQHNAHETNVVNKIKKKLERINLRQHRLGKVAESTDHYIGWCCCF